MDVPDDVVCEFRLRRLVWDDNSVSQSSNAECRYKFWYTEIGAGG